MMPPPDLPPQPPNAFAWLVAFVISNPDHTRRFIHVGCFLLGAALLIIIALNTTLEPGWWGRFITSLPYGYWSLVMIGGAVVGGVSMTGVLINLMRLLKVAIRVKADSLQTR